MKRRIEKKWGRDWLGFVRGAEMLWVFVGIMAFRWARGYCAPSVISGKLRVWSENWAAGEGVGRCKSLWGEAMGKREKCEFCALGYWANDRGGRWRLVEDGSFRI